MSACRLMVNPGGMRPTSGMAFQAAGNTIAAWSAGCRQRASPLPNLPARGPVPTPACQHSSGSDYRHSEMAARRRAALSISALRKCHRTSRRNPPLKRFSSGREKGRGRALATSRAVPTLRLPASATAPCRPHAIIGTPATRIRWRRQSIHHVDAWRSTHAALADNASRATAHMRISSCTGATPERTMPTA